MVDELHAHGWSDPQVAEAVYDAAYSSLLATISNAWACSRSRLDVRR